MGIKVLFIYPNTYGMSMVPPAIAFFSSILTLEGHEVELFDSTYYRLNYGVNSEGIKSDHLNVIPFDMTSILLGVLALVPLIFLIWINPDFIVKVKEQDSSVES